MKCVSFNVNGVRSILTKGFADVFSSFQADIFSLNETKFSEDNHLHFPFEPDGYSVYWTNSKVRKGYSGVAVFTKEPPLSVHYGLIDHKYDDEGRVITLEYDTFYYVACYVPNSGNELKRLPFRLMFEEDLRVYLSTLKSHKSVIYTGDLNVAHQEIDLKNPRSNMHNAGFTSEERGAMTQLLNEGYIDSFRYLYPQKIAYSWWSYRFQARLHNIGWRIDYFLVSADLQTKIISVDIHNDVFGSDHCPISLEIKL